MQKNEMTEAEVLDAQDELASFRGEFYIPEGRTYLLGNSLGLQPRRTVTFINAELKTWADRAVEGHFTEGSIDGVSTGTWRKAYEKVQAPLARLVGAKPEEVVAMNALTTNLHFMLATFYRPTPERNRILIEKNAFSSDIYAVKSHLKRAGLDPNVALVELDHDRDQILAQIESTGAKAALVLVGSTQYLTGEAFDLKAITQAARGVGARVGFDLAHGVGNVELRLHDWAPDFAVWCTYKYLNCGPGAVGGCFVHENNFPEVANSLHGWWGHTLENRFQMPPVFQPNPGAAGWQMSNSPIFSLAALRASLELFERAGFERLRQKSIRLTGFLERTLQAHAGFGERFSILTPKEPERRGAQLSLRLLKAKPSVVAEALKSKGILVDAREPDVLRAAPAPFYTRFADVAHFSQTFTKLIDDLVI